MKMKGKKKWIIVLLSIFIIVLVVLYNICNNRFKESKRLKYADEIEFYEMCIEKEKAWISAQQHPEGAIYLYEPEDDVPDAVNPYFACLAAQGLLAGAPSKENIDAVGKYLKWHSDELVKSNGMISDYLVEDMKLIAKGSYDSVDSYIAVYLSLLAEYVKKGGEISQIPAAKTSIEICIDRLKGLTKDGLTQVSPNNDTMYLMDNAEVLRAYKSMKILYAYKVISKDEYEFFEESADDMERAMKKNFWVKEEKRFDIGLNGNNTLIEFIGMEKFYPYAIAQVYPVAFDLWLTKEKDIEELYEEISENYNWKNSDVDEEFDWPVLCCIAVKLGDIESAREYIDEYCEVYRYNRSYPMDTTSSAWVIKGCEELINYYNEEAEKSLLREVWERIVK